VNELSSPLRESSRPDARSTAPGSRIHLAEAHG
jgi:hypothetical protein